MNLYEFYLLTHRPNGAVHNYSIFEVYAKNKDEAQALAQTYISKYGYSNGHYQTVSKVRLVKPKEALAVQDRLW